MKIKLQIKSRWTGLVLFEYEKENNTIKDTLIEAVKSGADLSNADLRDADLSNADLSGADLSGADLRDADLSNADLSGADLSGAYFCGANLRYASLRYANLRYASLRYANLRYANLNDAKEVPYIPFACPSDGAFIGWKKVFSYLVKLQIPEDARRLSATTNKCRCDKALVLDIIEIGTDCHINEILNTQSGKLLYKVGEMVFPDSFDENRWNECSHGIHFFINKQDAINY